MSSVVSPLFQTKPYPGVPPVTVRSMAPVRVPKQAMLVTLNWSCRESGCVTVMGRLCGQLLASTM